MKKIIKFLKIFLSQNLNLKSTVNKTQIKTIFILYINWLN